MFHRFFAWPAIFLAVICFWNIGGPAVAGKSIQPPEAIDGTLVDHIFLPFHEQAMRLAQRRSGRKGKKGGKKGKKSGDGAADESEGDRPDPEILKAFIPRKATTEAMDARGFFETGLRPVYPDGLDCQTGDSFFGTGTRGNGTIRAQRFYQGRHGGLDIPAKGIDIIAMADGEVVGKKHGESIGGTGIILRHSPEETGLGNWTFTEYKHLKDLLSVELHARVRQGDVVGVAWNTGTTIGKAYGPSGHYHLHLTAWHNARGDYKFARKKLIPTDGYWLDPLAMMRGTPIESPAVKDLPDDEKKVRFAYKTADGTNHPEGAKVIWPFVCR